ncbi:MAG: EF2563 family selenium-dependent molybdenum hydroxylase system protein [Candidatus Zixiibacteriota bacterium]|nr:MAG: EF2563 family selenium-dependent molybdenum hydroxylase system protein [candidate division Zixibacteria bacterium]
MTGNVNQNRIVVRGAGEMATGVIRRLLVAGYEVIALEQPSPCFVRRYVCCAEAFYQKKINIEEITAVLVNSPGEAITVSDDRAVPLLIDSAADSLSALLPLAVVDGRMLKENIDSSLDLAPIVIGLGPGFIAGQNCHAAIETNRGRELGKVFLEGHPQADTGAPSEINGVGARRVLRSPAKGVFTAKCRIADIVKAGQIIGEIAGIPISAQIDGMVRGLIHDGLTVTTDQKIGDIDPRPVRELCYRISDKADTIGRGVLEALEALKPRVNRE